MITAIILMCTNYAIPELRDCYSLVNESFYETEEQCIEAIDQLINHPMFEIYARNVTDNVVYSVTSFRCVDWSPEIF